MQASTDGVLLSKDGVVAVVPVDPEPPFGEEQILALLGTAGNWHDISDIATLSQDGAETTPVAIDADPIGRIADRSGNGYHYSTSESSRRPSYIADGQNGLPVARFDGANDRLDGLKKDLTNGIGRYRCMMVIKYTGSISGQKSFVYHSRGGANQARITVGYSGGHYTAGGRRTDGGGYIFGVGSEIDTSRFVIQEVEIDYATATVSSYLNGHLTGVMKNFHTAGTVAATDSHTVYLGADATDPPACDFAEKLEFTTELDPADVEKLRNYLAAKWGLDMSPPDSVVDGAWTWFNDPRAIDIDGVLTFGGNDNNGALFIQSGNERIIVNDSIPKDDHNLPAFLLRPDGHVLAFYAGHIAPYLYMRTSVQPLDSSQWGPEIDIAPQLGVGGITYANPVQLTGEENQPIYLFFRGNPGGGHTAMYSKSEDGGNAWSSAVQLFSGTRPYMKVSQNGGDRIDLFVSDGHPNEVVDNSLYHCYYENGGFYQSNGTLINQALPLVPADHLTRIFDGSTPAGEAWTWDMVIDESGNPVVVFAAFPATNDHRYHYARWTGSEWIGGEVAAAGAALYGGEPYYSGGIVIDPENVDVVYCSRRVSGRYQLFRYETSDAGETWTETQLTTGPEDRYRPYVVRGARKLVYMEGVYQSFINFTTRFAVLDLE